MIRLLLIAAATLLVSACAPMNLYGVPPAAPVIPDREPSVPLDATAIQAAMRPGHAIVKGQAFSKTVGGDVKYGAGGQILVLPNSDYVSQCIAILKMQYITTDCGKAIFPLGRVVIADGEGRFEIADLSPGDYSISTLITWGVPGRFGIEQTGGVVSTVVSVKSDTDVITANVN
jgi:hypothetical protein